MAGLVTLYLDGDFGRLRRYALMPSNTHDKISDDCDVYENYGDLSGTCAPCQFVYLQWEKRSGYDDREVLRPALSEQQSRALRQKYRCIGECARADFFQRPVIYGQHSDHDAVDEAIVGVHAKRVYCALHDLANIFVQELQSADTRCDQQKALYQLKHGN